MNLLLPTVLVTLGPAWAQDINAALTTVDAHNHTPGNGQLVPTSGLNINADLAFNTNRGISLLALAFNSLGSKRPTSETYEIYVDGNELYYNDGLGNQVQITNNGSVAGTPGSISGLVSPASASYDGTNTFIFNSNTNTRANLDIGSITLRPLTASAYGITISPPSGLAANYALTLPSALPGSTKILTVSSAGVVGDVYDVDGSTIVVAANVIKVPAQGITATQIANNTITEAQMAAASIGTTELIDESVTASKLAASVYTNTSNETATVTATSYTAVGSAINIVNVGAPRPILVNLLGSASESYLQFTSAASASPMSDVAFIRIKRDGTVIYETVIGAPIASTTAYQFLPPGVISLTDVNAAAGTRQYSLEAKVGVSGASLVFSNVFLFAQLQ